MSSTVVLDSIDFSITFIPINLNPFLFKAKYQNPFLNKPIYGYLHSIREPYHNPPLSHRFFLKLLLLAITSSFTRDIQSILLPHPAPDPKHKANDQVLRSKRPRLKQADLKRNVIKTQSRVVRHSPSNNLHLSPDPKPTNLRDRQVIPSPIQRSSFLSLLHDFPGLCR